MRRRFPTLICWLTLCAVAGFAATERSAVGTWKLDPAKSSYANMPAPKYEQLVVKTDEPGALKWTLLGAASNGVSYTSSYDGPVDGQYHPIASSEAADTIAYTRMANGGVKWTMKDKAGKVMETGSSHLSADGTTLTVKGTVEGLKGKSDFVSVFTRMP